MYISLMAIERDNFIQTVDTVKSYRRDFAHLISKGQRLDTLHTAEQLRQDIIKAAKIVVGFDVLNLFINVQEINVPEHVWGKKVVSEDFKRSKADQYAKFARVPFNVIFIENYTGGHLVRRNPDGVTWTQTTFIHAPDVRTGEMMVLCMAQDMIVDPTKTDVDGFVSTTMIPSETFKPVIARGDTAIVRSQARVHASQVAETLLFLNVKNGEPQRYKASKTDIRGSFIPRVYEPYVDYRILDIYRRKEPIKSLDDLLKRVVDLAKARAESRAHLVRGHFKTVRGDLYWWNPFMRNRHRLESHGFADKDYRLKT